MSFATKCVCDGCGKIKGDANKWLLVYEFAFHIRKDCRPMFFGVRTWDDEAAQANGVRHVCTAACMQKMLGEFLGASVTVVPAVSAEAQE